MDIAFPEDVKRQKPPTLLVPGSRGVYHSDGVGRKKSGGAYFRRAEYNSARCGGSDRSRRASYFSGRGIYLPPHTTHPPPGKVKRQKPHVLLFPELRNITLPDEVRWRQSPALLFPGELNRPPLIPPLNLTDLRLQAPSVGAFVRRFRVFLRVPWVGRWSPNPKTVRRNGKKLK